MSSQNIGEWANKVGRCAKLSEPADDNSCQTRAANKCFAKDLIEDSSGAFAPFSAEIHQKVGQ